MIVVITLQGGKLLDCIKIKLVTLNKGKCLFIKIVASFIIAFLFVFFAGYTLNQVKGSEKKDKDRYDVIVVGSDPEGIAAAVSAARNGLDTLLVDYRDRVGGLYTVGQLNMLDINYISPKRKEIVNKGIFDEFYRAIGSSDSFDITVAQKVFDQMLQTAGIDLLLNVSFEKPLMAGSQIVGIQVKGKEQIYQLYGKRIIDATQDGYLAAACGAPFSVAREDLGVKHKYGAATLVFRVKNVDWARVIRYLEKDKNPYTGANLHSAWGYAQMFNYQSTDPDIQMRGFNAGRQNDGTVLINALQIFNLNPLDQQCRKLAVKRAQQELPKIIKYINKNCPGFENAELDGTAQELYIRESRHIEGEYKLTAEDVFENRYHENGIAYGSYPVDLQASRKGLTGCALNGYNPYSIPFGVMVPLKVENLLVASKAASYDSIAHGSARTVPVGMAIGQAAGVAAKYSLETGKSFRLISEQQADISMIKRLLEQQGVDLNPILITNPEVKSWSYQYIRYLRDRAVLSKGYYNDYKVDERATLLTFRRIITLINNNTDSTIDLEILKNYPEKITKNQILNLTNCILGKKYSSFTELFRVGAINEDTYRHVQKQPQYLTNAEVYGLFAGIVALLTA